MGDSIFKVVASVCMIVGTVLYYGAQSMLEALEEGDELEAPPRKRKKRNLSSKGKAA